MSAPKGIEEIQNSLIGSFGRRQGTREQFYVETRHWAEFIAAKDDQLAALTSRIATLEAALRDFSEHGVRHDLNPTMELHSDSDASDLFAAIGFFYNYLKSVDGYVRGRAADALKGNE